MDKLYVYSLRSPKQSETGHPEIKVTSYFYREVADDLCGKHRRYYNCYKNQNSYQVMKRIFFAEGVIQNNTMWFKEEQDMNHVVEMFLKDKRYIQKELSYPNGLVDEYVRYLEERLQA